MHAGPHQFNSPLPVTLVIARPVLDHAARSKLAYWEAMGRFFSALHFVDPRCPSSAFGGDCSQARRRALLAPYGVTFPAERPGLLNKTAWEAHLGHDLQSYADAAEAAHKRWPGYGLLYLHADAWVTPAIAPLLAHAAARQRFLMPSKFADGNYPNVDAIPSQEWHWPLVLPRLKATVTELQYSGTVGHAWSDIFFVPPAALGYFARGAAAFAFHRVLNEVSVPTVMLWAQSLLRKRGDVSAIDELDCSGGCCSRYSVSELRQELSLRPCGHPVNMSDPEQRQAVLEAWLEAKRSNQFTPPSSPPSSVDIVCPPQTGHVAVVLRGGAFRDGSRFGHDCLTGGMDKQFEATSSLLQHVIMPLESSCGARVDLFVSVSGHLSSELEHCTSMVERLYSYFGERVVAQETRLSAGQDIGMRMALDLFKRRRGALSAYSLVIVARHDFIFRKPITLWQTTSLSPVNFFSRFNFFSRCERRCPENVSRESFCESAKLTSPCCGRGGDDPPNCVSDLLYTMPGGLFDAFDGAVGQEGCFNGTDSGSGHRACGFEVPRWIERTAPGVSSSDSWGFLTDWRPRQNVRKEWAPLGHLL